MVKLKDFLSPQDEDFVSDAIHYLNLCNYALKNLMQEHAPAIKELGCVLDNALGNILPIVQSKEMQIYLSISKCGTIIHPIYFDLFDSEFSISNIEERWHDIFVQLINRFPKNLENDFRKERYEEFLRCQTAGSYIAVCRSIYPEIEALFRDEFILSNDAWMKEWAQDDVDSRARKIRRKTESLVYNNLHEYKLANEHASIKQLGIFTAQFIVSLRKAFENFDPTNTEKWGDEGFRHLNAHGFIKSADFMNGLNGLLLFDLALQTVADMKRKKATA